MTAAHVPSPENTPSNSRTHGNGGINVETSEGFVRSTSVESIVLRGLCYMDTGYSVHFAGPAGTGKTTLALFLAQQRGRPITFIQGDESLTGKDLLGREVGWKRSSKVDNYVRSVVKTEEEMRQLWVDSQVLTACTEGHTLIYDEFNRSRAEANNIFLGILSEGLIFSGRGRGRRNELIRVHPDFRLVLTSNPEEYAGVHRTQDALLDRLITLTIDYFDRETEIEIVCARSGIGVEDGRNIVNIVRNLREVVGPKYCWPTLRSAIALARVLALQDAHATPSDPVFSWVCEDIFNPETFKNVRAGDTGIAEKILSVLAKLTEKFEHAS